MEFTPEAAVILAERFVEAFEQDTGVRLDFGDESIREVEAMAGRLHDAGDTSETVPNWMMRAGCYIGEVLVRQHGARWVEGDAEEVPEAMRGDLVLRVPKKSAEDDPLWVAPYEKVGKRLDGGPEDNLVSYYRMILRYGPGTDMPPAPEVGPSDEASSEEDDPSKKPGLLTRLFGL